MDRYHPDNICFFDFESQSPIAIELGAYRYAVEAKPILLAYAIGAGPVQLVDRGGHGIRWCDLPDELRTAYEAGMVFCAWNTGFDRAIWNYAMEGSPFLAPAQVIDARCTALAHNLPDDLEHASTRLGGPGKRKDGKVLIGRFCEIDAILAAEAPEEWERFCLYARQDVEELRRVFRLMLPALTDYDWKVYQANEVVNDNGCGVDLVFCEKAAALAKEEGERIGGQLGELTSGAVTSVYQHLKLAQWVHDHLPSTDAREIMSIAYKEEAEDEDDEALVEKIKFTVRRGVVERLLDYLRAAECTDKVLMEVLELREYGASAAPKKFKAILDTHVDKRVHGQFQFNGGGQTGRFSGKGVQLQNLTRTVLGKDPSDDYGYWEESTVALIADGCSLDELLEHGNRECAARKLALTVRPAFCAPAGRTLVKADYSQIEARVLPWLSRSKGGEQLLARFRQSDIDPSAPDLYVTTAADMMGKKPAAISKEERQRGKVAVLACIAEGQLVLTRDHGPVPIEQVSNGMRVWDGVSWVRHGGVVFQGEREVITYDGLTATPDHMVWAEGYPGKRPFGTVAEKRYRLLRTNAQNKVRWQRRKSGPTAQAAEVVSGGTVRTYDILNAGPFRRFTVSGVLVSNCGFGGGKNALHSMAANYRMHFSDKEAQDIVNKWRAANPWAPAFWGKRGGRRVIEPDGTVSYSESYGLFGAAREAIDTPMTKITAGRISFVYVPVRRSGMLIMILPSGRPLIYPSCRMRDYDVIDKTTKQVVDKRHGLTFRRARGMIALYGGRFAENATQACAADLLRESIVRLVSEGHMVVSHSHDEIMVECDVADVDRTISAMETAMTFDRPWAAGLPLAVDVTERWYYSASKKPPEMNPT